MTSRDLIERSDAAFKVIGAPECRRLYEFVTAKGRCSLGELLAVRSCPTATAVRRVRLLCAAGWLSDDQRKAQRRYGPGPAFDHVLEWSYLYKPVPPALERSRPPLQPILTALRPTANRVVLQAVASAPGLRSGIIAKRIGLSDPEVSRATSQLVAAGLMTKTRTRDGVALRFQPHPIWRVRSWLRTKHEDPEALR